MTDWSGEDYVNELARRPGARPPASVGEIWNANWTATGLDTIGGIGRPYADATTDLESAIEGASGKSLTDYAWQNNINLAAASSPDERAVLLGRLADALPDEKARAKIEPLKDVRARAADKAAAIERDAADTASATYGLSGIGTSWLAGVARMTVDPANLAAMVATAPIAGGSGLLVSSARMAASGAAAQALIEPVLQPMRADLGLESGVSRAMSDILGAAEGGAALNIGGRLLWRTLRGAYHASRAGAPVEAPLAPADFNAAASLAERDHLMNDTAPAGDAAAVMAHAERIDATAQTLERGAPLPLTDTRGHGVQYHGTSAADLVPTSDHYSSLNYYGQGFYTTDAIDVARGYSKRGAAATGERNLYAVSPQRDLKILDMERPVPSDLLDRIKSTDARPSTFDEIKQAAIEESPKNTREVYDNIREIGTAEGLSADGVQEIFDSLNQNLQALGYDGISHAGGLRTGTKAHKVVVYFNPEKDLAVAKQSFDAFRAAPETAPLLSEHPLPPEVKAEPIAAPEPKAPAPGEAAPQGEPAPVKLPGDPALAAQAAAIARDADFEVHLPDGENGTRKVMLRQALAETGEDASATKEILDCMGGG